MIKMIFLIIILILIIFILAYYKKTKKKDNRNYAIPDRYSQPSKQQMNHIINENEEPYYIYADADKHHEVHIDDHDETHVDDFEEL